MREIKKTYSRIVISENTQNKSLETLISMKFDTECNETTPAMSFHRFHDYYEILTRMTSESRPVPSQTSFLFHKKNKTKQNKTKQKGQIWNISDLYKDGDHRGPCRFNFT